MNATRGLLALIGLIWLLGGPALRLLLSPLLVSEIMNQVESADGTAVAKTKVTRGGFGTVWTTSILIEAAGETWIVYQTRDSDFLPPVRWLSNRTLSVGLPCGRFGHLSNPDDWELEARPNRVRVRFYRPQGCGDHAGDAPPA